MKTFQTAIHNRFFNLLFLLFLTDTVYAQTSVQEKFSIDGRDTITKSAIKTFVEDAPGFLYPLATERMYMRNGYKPIWLSSNTPDQFWDAMMLLDCSIQYGLDHHDYHADQLTYTNLRNIIHNNDLKLAARLDVLLTDAMLAFISHLHYGKLAPFYTPATTDQADFKGFRADTALANALNSKIFTVSITNIQPDNKAYRDLQDMLRLMTGQYVGDSYETGIETVKLIALNMERWRWEKAEPNSFVSINIPSFNLRYNQKGQYQEFKVIVGKSATPTPVLSSAIGYFTTAPDWTVPQKILIKELLPMALKRPGYLDKNNFRIYDKKGNTVGTDPINLSRIKANIADYIVKQSPGCDNALGKIAFNFPNDYSIYLHDTPDRDLFNQAERALSHGCIRLENPEEFAKLLLKADAAPERTYSELHQAMENYQRKRFTMKTPVPIFLRYFTCEMKDGILLSYKDLYKKDKELSDQLFGSHDLLVTEVKEYIRKKAEGFGNGRSPVVQK